MHLKNLLVSSVIALLALAIFLISLWRPERQVTLHQQHLLAAFSDRKWDRISALLDNGYKDGWEQDKATVLQRSRIALAQFFSPQISGFDPQIRVQSDSAIVSEKLKLSGEGNEFAQIATRRVNEIKSPFIFTWQRKSWKPWDWKLVRVENAELTIPALEDF